ncbi:MAG: hypothetical protein KBA33_08620 [Cloacibacterium sp.]|nr:hypothetical protein [Cloacibacterium sp.]
MKVKNSFSLFWRTWHIYAVLGLFLFSNYFVNYTELHSHHQQKAHYSVAHTTDDFSDKTHENIEETDDCLVCDFQCLVYHPLAQEYFFTEENTKKSFSLVKQNSISQLLAGTEFSFQQRGPPAFL